MSALTVISNAGERKLLLEGHAHVGAAEHERKMIERGRDHRILERGDDGGPGLARANARIRRLDLVSAFPGDADHVRQADWRRERPRRLGGGMASRQEQQRRDQSQ